jgi:hypothetical protein
MTTTLRCDYPNRFNGDFECGGQFELAVFKLWLLRLPGLRPLTPSDPELSSFAPAGFYISCQRN